MKYAQYNYVIPNTYANFFEKNDTLALQNNQNNAKVINNSVINYLQSKQIDVLLENILFGPHYTTFEYKTLKNSDYCTILSLYEEIKHSIKLDYLIINNDAMPLGKFRIIIENIDFIKVDMASMFNDTSNEFQMRPLSFPLGMNINGSLEYCDLEDTFHLLLAGSTGTGKTMCLNTIISSLILKNSPNDIKLVLIDTMKAEYTPYKDVPHLLWPVINSTEIAIKMLARIVILMEERYEDFIELGVKNIKTFNKIIEENQINDDSKAVHKNKMPNIVVVIDDVTDIINNYENEFDVIIKKISERGLATGVHLIFASSSLSSKVIAQYSKTNIPGKIAFDLISSSDSRVLFNCDGAESLKGNGEMMYRKRGDGHPYIIQGTYISDKEINNIANYARNQCQVEYDNTYLELSVNTYYGSANADSMDSLYDDVVEFVKAQQKASTSLLQRRFGIGYNRAARLIDTLEDRGLIGPANGAMPREVYLKPDNNSIRKYERIETDYENKNAPFLINITKEEFDNSNNSTEEIVSDDQKSSGIRSLFKLFKNK